MAAELHLSVVTPEGALYDAEAAFVAIPCADGEIGILPGHTALIAELGAGMLRIKKETLGGEVTDSFAIRGGFVQVVANVVTLLVTEAAKPGEVDAEVVAADRERVMEALKHPASDAEFGTLLADRRWVETRERLDS